MNEIINTLVSPINTMFKYTCDNFYCKCKQTLFFNCYNHSCNCKTGLNKQYSHSRDPSECSDNVENIDLTPTDYKNVRFNID